MGNDVKLRLFSTINTMMTFQEDLKGEQLRWFFCFGTLLEYIADREFNLDYDIDIGVLYEECNTEKLAESVQSYGYKVTKTVLHDVTKKPLNIHLEPVGALAGTPTLDIYCWLRSGNMLYHTYDIDKKNQEIPDTYTFKGVKAEWICPPEETIKKERTPGHGRTPEIEHILDKKGTWHYDIWGDHSGYTFACPFYYGTLLDTWYPGWRFRKLYNGQSKSPWIKKVKSCKNL